MGISRNGISRVKAILGELNTAAATGAVSDAKATMGYIKQLVTAILDGTYGLSNLQVLIAALQADLDNGTDGLGALKALLDAIPTTAMRGTDGAALASVLGALDTAAATGAVTDTDLVMAYIKQMVTYDQADEITSRHAPRFTGNIYYVDAAQSDDTGNGLTPSTAKKTIGAAITAASSGDAITVKAGTYVEDVVMDKASMELWCEMGTILDGTGTCLTVSGGTCRIKGPVKITPAADQIGVLVSTAVDNRFEDIRVKGSAAACGWDFNIGGNVVINCTASGIKAGGKAFDIGASGTKLYNCYTVGTTTSYGYYVNGTALTKGILQECSSAGHQTSGFYLDEISDMTVFNCVSGGGDGKWLDVNNANVWCNFCYDDEVFKEINFTDNSTTFNLFKVTGIVEVESIFGHVEEALNAEFGDCKLEVAAGGNTADLTTTVSLNSLPVGSFIGKTAHAGVALTTATSATPQVVENISYKKPDVASIIVAEAGTDTYIRLLSDDAVGNKDGKIHWHCLWKPWDEDGFVQAA